MAAPVKTAIKQHLFGDFEIRSTGVMGKPVFVAKDVCEVLGIANSRDAVASLDDDEHVSVVLADTSSSSRKTITVQAVTESGLYHLIFKSRKAVAKRFRRWVTEEVLPSIRRTGKYALVRPFHSGLPRHAVDDQQGACQCGCMDNLKRRIEGGAV